MVKHSDNNKIDNNNKSSNENRLNIDELLAAKRNSNKLGNDKAAKAVEAATNSVRKNAGKARRSELRNDLVKSAQLAQAQGEEEGIKQFLSEDIPAVMNALNGELRSNHIASIEANEARLIEGVVVDVEWSDYETDYDMSFETEEWGGGVLEASSLERGASTSNLLEGSKEKSTHLGSMNKSKSNRFKDGLPEL